MIEDSYLLLCRQIHRLTGLDLISYKERQMKRRLTTFMLKLEVNDYEELAKKLSQDKEALDKFRKFVTINVTEFFRNPEQYQTLKEKILPQLIEPGRTFKVWSAGCSDGSEPYSIAMLLEEMGITNYEIHATDLDREILAKARLGVYRKEAVDKVPSVMVKKYFNQGNGDLYQFSPKLASKVNFYEQNLLKDNYKKDFDLIVCRNVVIYFTEEAKNQVFQKMAQSLRKDGILFVGGTESILAPKSLGLQTSLPFFYKKSDES